MPIPSHPPCMPPRHGDKTRIPPYLLLLSSSLPSALIYHLELCLTFDFIPPFATLLLAVAAPTLPPSLPQPHLLHWGSLAPHCCRPTRQSNPSTHATRHAPGHSFIELASSRQDLVTMASALRLSGRGPRCMGSSARVTGMVLGVLSFTLSVALLAMPVCLCFSVFLILLDGGIMFVQRHNLEYETGLRISG